MKDTILAVAEILNNAERQLREQMQAAAAQGDYETLLLITSSAKKVAEIAAETRIASEEPIPAASVPTSAPPPKPVLRKSSRAYPKFFRNGQSLVKIGWSKSERAEYEHRAPLTVLNQVVAGIERATNRQRFAMEAVLSTIAMPDGAEIPNYQSYLCLAWLRHEALVVQHGRQGYSVKTGIKLTTEVGERFAHLPDIGSRTLSQEEKVG